MTQHPRGQYIIEVMLALGLFMVFVGSLSLLAIDASKTTQFQERELQGVLSLQNAVEAIHSIAKNSWDTLTIGTYGLALQSSQWTLSPTETTENDITKKVTISYARRNTLGDIDPLGTEDQRTKQVDIEVSRASTGKLLFSHSMLLTQAIKQLQNWHETTTADFADGTFTSTVGTSTGDGEITLAQGEKTTTGFPFLLPFFRNTSTIADANDRVSFRFTSLFSSPVSEVRVYVASHTGNSSIFRFGIQTDNAGLPSGTYLTSGTFIASSNGWKTITLSPAYTPTPGTTLHLVGERVSGKNSVTLRTSTPLQNINPSTGQTDTEQQTLSTTDGVTWTANNLQPLMIVQDTLGNLLGNSYTTTTSQAIWGTTEIGEVVRFSQDTVIQGATLTIGRSGTPTGNLLLTIRDLTTDSVLGQQETIATPGQASTTMRWITKDFTNPITIPATHTIRLELSSSGSTQSSRRYNTQIISSLASTPYQDTTYGGTENYAATKTGTLWTANISSDIPFSLQIARGYAASGTYESSAKDTGNPLGIFGTLSWTAQTPAGTSLSFQTRTASTSAGLASAQYVGPDGTSSTSYTNGGTIAIDPGSSGTQFIQYRIKFTGTPSNAPQVENVQITYE
ncbi:MAG: hypothetical protein WC495_01695 [Patescibacteria group bacterium]|jgi:hypothetical protein